MTAEARHPTLRVLALSDLRAFVVARFFGTIARECGAATLAWNVFDLTGRERDLGLLGLVEFLPVVPVLLLAGVVADSRERRDVVVLARLAALVMAGLLCFGASSGASLAWLLGAAFGLAVAHAFEAPSASSLLPSLP